MKTQTVTVIIPVHNEEKIIKNTVQEAVASFKKLKLSGELIIIENGSKDQTLSILKRLEKQTPILKILSISEGNKGKALKKGMFAAKGNFLILIDADLWDERFLKKSIDNLRRYDIVIGSKAIRGASDNRPVISRIVSRLYNFSFKIIFNFKGTETHAKLSFRRDKILPIVRVCQTDGLVFDTELIIRAEREGLSKLEVPTEVSEIRPRVFSFKKELHNVYKSFVILLKTIGPSINRTFLILLGCLILLIAVLFQFTAR